MPVPIPGDLGSLLCSFFKAEGDKNKMINPSKEDSGTEGTGFLRTRGQERARAWEAER